MIVIILFLFDCIHFEFEDELERKKK